MPRPSRRQPPKRLTAEPAVGTAEPRLAPPSRG